MSCMQADSSARGYRAPWQVPIAWLCMVMQGWNMALKDPNLEFPQQAADIDALIQKRISGKLKVMPAPPPPPLGLVGCEIRHGTSAST